MTEQTGTENPNMRYVTEHLAAVLANHDYLGGDATDTDPSNVRTEISNIANLLDTGKVTIGEVNDLGKK